MALCLENNLCECLSLCVRDAQRDMLHSELLSNFPRLVLHGERRPAAGLSHHLPIAPAYPASPPCSSSLHCRFFCRKPSGVAFVSVFELLAVLSFLRRVHSSQKYLTMALNRRLDAAHLGNVHAHSYDQDASSARLTGCLRLY